MNPDHEPDLVVDRLRAAGCVFAEDEARLLSEAARSPAELDALVARRVAGLPLEPLLGWAAFAGLRLAVDLGVFVPRRRTEHLVHEAAALIGDGSVVLDLCCGCGAVGAALLAGPHRGVGGAAIELHAADIDPVALACARRNIGSRGVVHQGDLFDALPAALRGRIDVLVANAPYVPTGSIALMPPEARDHESRVALDGGVDGLDIQRRVARAAPDWLAPGGRLLVETSEPQSEATCAVFAEHGLQPRVSRSAELEATVVIGRRGAG